MANTDCRTDLRFRLDCNLTPLRFTFNLLNAKHLLGLVSAPSDFPPHHEYSQPGLAASIGWEHQLCGYKRTGTVFEHLQMGTNIAMAQIECTFDRLRRKPLLALKSTQFYARFTNSSTRAAIDGPSILMSNRCLEIRGQNAKMSQL
jgi:hypothetical protein